MPTPGDADTPDLTAHQIGNIGERLARSHLESRGYRILATNYRCRWGEIDLIAWHGSTLVFVEVRTRRGTAYGSPEESITQSKAQRLVSTAQHYIDSTAERPSEVDWRIDLIAIQLGPGQRVLNIRHLENVVAE